MGQSAIMGMSQEQVSKQIENMVNFIIREGKEKSDEIRVKADEEFNIEKLRLIESEKAKLRTEYERKEKQAEIKKRIQQSNQVAASRLKLLQARDQAVADVREAAVKAAIDPALSALKSKTGKTVKASLDTSSYLPAGPRAGFEGETCCGGVVVSDVSGRISVANTLDSRLNIVYQQKLPDIRKTLFGASKTRTWLQ